MHNTTPDYRVATGRIVSLAMLVDGWVGHEERSALLGTGLLEKVGLDAVAFEQIFEAFLLETAQAAGEAEDIRARISAERIDELLGQIEDPAVQSLLLAAMTHIAQADGLLTRDERALLQQAQARWPRATSTTLM